MWSCTDHAQQKLKELVEYLQGRRADQSRAGRIRRPTGEDGGLKCESKHIREKWQNREAREILLHCLHLSITISLLWLLTMVQTVMPIPIYAYICTAVLPVLSITISLLWLFGCSCGSRSMSHVILSESHAAFYHPLSRSPTAHPLRLRRIKSHRLPPTTPP